MMYKIKKILGQRQIPRKDGTGTFPITTVLTSDDEVVEVVGSPKQGEELEGEIEVTQYGKRLKRASRSNVGPSKGYFADPDTMLIAYAKDLVIALIGAGIVKKEKEAADYIRNFCQLFFGIYAKRKQGQIVAVEVDEDDEDSEKVVDRQQQDQQRKEIDLEEIPF